MTAAVEDRNIDPWWHNMAASLVDPLFMLIKMLMVIEKTAGDYF